MKPLRHLWLRWLDRRLPRAPRVQLDHHRIFILPSGYGLLYLVATALIFLGGINYENNAILALCFLMASLFLVAILHTFRNLSGLALRAGAVRNGFAGGDGALQVVLMAERHAHRSLWLSWAGQTAQEASLEPGDDTALWLNLPLPQRGRIRPPRLRVESRYPLGLLRCWSLVALDHTCLAWPRPERRSECPADGGNDALRAVDVRQGGGNDEFAGLRSYRHGDSPRLMDWKGYARRRALNVKQFEEPVSGRLWLRYEHLQGLPTERRLSVLCYWVGHLAERHCPFALALPGAELPPGRGEAHRRAALDLLACFGEGKS